VDTFRLKKTGALSDLRLTENFLIDSGSREGFNDCITDFGGVAVALVTKAGAGMVSLRLAEAGLVSFWLAGAEAGMASFGLEGASVDRPSMISRVSEPM